MGLTKGAEESKDKEDCLDRKAATRYLKIDFKIDFRSRYKRHTRKDF